MTLYKDVKPNIEKQLHSRISGAPELFVIYGVMESKNGRFYHAYYVDERNIQRHESFTAVEAGMI
jgi:hypothetical protein